VVAGTLVYAFLSLIGVPHEFGMSLAGVIFGALPMLHTTLEKRTTPPGKSVLPQGVVSMAGFALPWYLVLMYGFGLMLAAWEYLSFVAGLIAGFAAGTSDAITITSLIMALLVTPAPFFLIGRWLGMRSESYGMALTAAAVVLMVIVDTFLLLLFSAEYIFGEGSALFGLLGLCAGKIALIIWLELFTLVGFWRGQSLRLQRYIEYLTGVLPVETRSVLANLAYEEAQRLWAQQASPATTGPVPGHG
jgi:hypothetical protein